MAIRHQYTDVYGKSMTNDSLIGKFHRLKAQGCPSIEIDSIIQIIKDHTAAPDVVERVGFAIRKAWLGHDGLFEVAKAAITAMGGESSRDVGETYSESPPPTTMGDASARKDEEITFQCRDHAGCGFPNCKCKDEQREISVITPHSNSLPDLLDALEIHLVDYPTPENIHMQRKYLSDIRQQHIKPVSVSLESLTQKAAVEYNRVSQIEYVDDCWQPSLRHAIKAVLDVAGVKYGD